MKHPEKPIFVCGAARGGTTMTKELISTHSRIETSRELPEKLVVNLVKYMTKFKRISQKKKGGKKEVFKNNELLYCQNMLKELWRITLKSYPGVERKPRIVFKKPWGEKHFELYNEIFADCRPLFVYCMRNGISVLTSLKNFKPGRKFDINSNLDRFKNSMRSYLKIKNDYPNNILLVQIDTVNENSQDRIAFGQSIMDFIGEKMEEPVLNCLKEWKSVNSKSQYKRLELSQEELEVIHKDDEFLELQKKFGYSL